jgi:hypothetical protein
MITEYGIPKKEEVSEEAFGFPKGPIVLSTKAYYTIPKALEQTFIEFRNQIKNKLVEFKANEAKANRRYCTKQDVSEAEGEYSTKKEVDKNFNLKRHFLIKEVEGVLCRIEIDEYPIGSFSEKRNSYMIVSISAISYKSNNIGLKLTKIARSKVLRFRTSGEKKKT